MLSASQLWKVSSGHPNSAPKPLRHLSTIGTALRSKGARGIFRQFKPPICKTLSAVESKRLHWIEISHQDAPFDETAYRPVHVKTLRSQKLRMLLTHRKLLQSKAIAIENDLRGTLRNFGLKVGMVGKVKFEARIKELVENFPDLAELVEPLLVVRRVLREQIVKPLDKKTTTVIYLTQATTR
jgi:hypothetical protein